MIGQKAGDVHVNKFLKFAVKALGISAFFFFICVFFCVNDSLAEAEKPFFTDVGQLNYAKFLVREKDYKAAAREYARLIEIFPESPLIPEAQFRMSESLYDAGLYSDAEEEFKLFLNNFKESRFAPEAKARLEDMEVSKRADREDLPVVTLREEPEIPGIKAVQVMFFEGVDYGGIDKEMRRLREAGIDTVIVRVFHNLGDRYHRVAAHRVRAGVYFRTTHAPVVDDILGRFISLAHGNGLKVFAWMTTRYADYGVENDTELACKGYDLASRKVFRCEGLDMFNERAVKRLEAIYSDLADYDIDGILFQDDLFLRHNEGFGAHMDEQYEKETGRSVDPESFYLRTADRSVHYTEAFWQWASWKNRRLLNVAGRLKAAVKKKRPNAKFAINLMYESVTSPAFALAWLSQSLEASLKAGFDYFSIMAYQRQMEEELRLAPSDVRILIGKMVKDAAKTVGDPHRVLIKLQTIDWKTGRPISNDEVVSLIRDIRTIKEVSLAVVPYRGDFPFLELSTKGLASN